MLDRVLCVNRLLHVHALAALYLTPSMRVLTVMRIVSESWVLYDCSVLQPRRSFCSLSYYYFHHQVLKNLVSSWMGYTI